VMDDIVKHKLLAYSSSAPATSSFFCSALAFPLSFSFLALPIFPPAREESGDMATWFSFSTLTMNDGTLTSCLPTLFKIVDIVIPDMSLVNHNTCLMLALGNL
jgi:hypothetical protein